jgi:hypothetical protein
MTVAFSTDATKELLLHFIMENIDYRKRCSHLQEIIAMGRVNTIWHKALTMFFKEPMHIITTKTFSKN